MKSTSICGLVLTLTLGGTFGSYPAVAQQPSCTFYRVAAELLNVSSADGSKYIDAMKSGELACVTGTGKSGGKDWGYIAFKVMAGNQEAKVGGWGELALLKKITEAEVRKGVAAAPAEPVGKSVNKELSVEPAAKQSEADTKGVAQKAAATSSEPLRFDQPIPVGPYPVNGRSIEELQKGTPLFPPLPELPEELWKKPCSTCHKWNKKRLCAQGGFYLNKARHLFRHQHPYGGPYKVALMRWARSGCN